MSLAIVIVAHPDDETMLCGGTLALLAQRGWELHIACATRGEGGEMGDPSLCSREELGAWREQEMRCAIRALGAAGVEFLGYVDPVVGADNQLYAFDCEPAQVLRQLQGMIAALRPELVITHGTDGEYGHPAHRLLGQIAREAAQSSRPAPLLYSFSAQAPGREDRVWNRSDPAHLVLDIRPWLDFKEAAALCHATQHAMFFRNHPEAEGVRAALRTLETFHRHSPPVESGRPEDAFAALLLAAGAWAPELR